jgi:hypothetical protein
MPVKRRPKTLAAAVKRSKKTTIDDLLALVRANGVIRRRQAHHIAVLDKEVACLALSLRRLETQMDWMLEGAAQVFAGAQNVGAPSDKLDALLAGEQSEPVVVGAVRYSGRDEPLPDDVVVTALDEKGKQRSRKG